MRSVFRSRMILIALGASAALRATPASAADDQGQSADGAGGSDVATARALFAEGRALTARGDYEPACKKFESSLKLSAGVGTRFNLADCWEHIGRSASAYRMFLAAADAARAAAQTERAEVAQRHAERLVPLLARIAVQFEATEPDLAVAIDQARMERETWGSVAIDPGPHNLEVTAPGKVAWSRGIDLKPGASLVVYVPTLQPVAPPQPSQAGAEAPGPRAAVTPPMLAHADPSVRPATPSVIVLGLAAVGLSGFIAGTVFGLHYQALDERAIAICPSGNGCSAEQVAAHAAFVADARQSGNLAIAGFSLGTLALVGAAALYLHQSPAPPRAGRAWSVEPTLSADGSWGASARGRF